MYTLIYLYMLIIHNVHVHVNNTNIHVHVNNTNIHVHINVHVHVNDA